MYQSMKIKDLRNYGIPSYVLDIWKEHYSPCLLPLQEEAVRNYGVLNCGGNEEGRMQYAPTEGIDSRLRGNNRKECGNDIKEGRNYRENIRNDKRGETCNDKNNNNLLVIAPPSSGKSFLGEMAAMAQAIHQKKIIYLTPFRFYAEEKYSHLKNLYGNCGLGTIISTRNAVMDCEKFNYFLLIYPEFLTDVSLVIIDEMQIIDDPKWGPLLEEIIDQLLKKDLVNLRIIALSAHIKNQNNLLKWFPAHPLISYPRPVEMRKGVVREGVFKYTTLNEENTCGREVFFQPEAVRDNCFEDYLLETVKYFVKKDEPTLIFSATPAETRKWAKRLASRLESPAASSAIKELHQMEDTLSRKELLEVLEKSIAYHNPELSWEERNLVETYLKKGEIKIVCAAVKYSIGINLPFKNIIIPSDKIHNDDGNYLHDYRTNLNLADVGNMGRRAANSGFGRIIFLAYSLVSETIYQNTYSSFTQDNSANRQLVKEEEGLLTYLLRLVVKYRLKLKEIKEYVKDGGNHPSDGGNHPSGYWQFRFKQENIEKKIDKCLNILKGNKLIREIKGGILSPTANGILITALIIKAETYLFFKNWMGYCKKGGISDLEILLLLAFSADGRALPIPFSQFYRDDEQKESYGRGCRGNYRNKLLHLILKQGDEDKKLYRDKIILKKTKEDSIPLEDYLAFKKTCLLYDWIKEDKDIKTIEQENCLYGGTIQLLGEGFSWLADSLMEIAENEGWRKSRGEDLNKIKILSERLIDGVEEEGLSLAGMHIPGLSRYYIGRLVGAGYGDGKFLKEASEEGLNKILPKRLVNRIQKRFAPVFSSSFNKNDKPKTKNPSSTSCNLHPETRNPKPVTVLEIDIHRPDRIIFMGEKIGVTATEFSLIHLLAQHNEQVISYNEFLEELWKDEEDAIYNRVSFHLSKIRRTVLKTIGENKIGKEKLKYIFAVVSGRGAMLRLKAEEIKII
jgi:helicase